MKLLKYFLGFVALLSVIFIFVVIFVKPPELPFTLNNEPADNPNIPRIQQAAEQGNAEAQFAYGYCLSHGKNITENKTEAVKWLKKSADQGFPMAQAELGSCYYFGHGVSQDKEKGISLIKQAIQNGFTEGQKWLDAIEKKEKETNQ